MLVALTQNAAACTVPWQGSSGGGEYKREGLQCSRTRERGLGRIFHVRDRDLWRADWREKPLSPNQHCLDARELQSIKFRSRCHAGHYFVRFVSGTMVLSFPLLLCSLLESLVTSFFSSKSLLTHEWGETAQVNEEHCCWVRIRNDLKVHSR